MVATPEVSADGNCHMGGYAELCADTHGITREDQDAHADESYL